MASSKSRLIYAAHPMTTYGTARESTALALLSELMPEAQIINPATRYRDNAHWKRDWPKLLLRLAGLVVFGDSEGTIGTGCLHEMADAWWHGMSVTMLDCGGACCDVMGIEVLPQEVRTALRAGILIAGPIRKSLVCMSDSP